MASVEGKFPAFEKDNLESVGTNCELSMDDLIII
jgi:hypothetical protein